MVVVDHNRPSLSRKGHDRVQSRNRRGYRGFRRRVSGELHLDDGWSLRCFIFHVLHVDRIRCRCPDGPPSCDVQMIRWGTVKARRSPVRSLNSFGEFTAASVVESITAERNMSSVEVQTIPSEHANALLAGAFVCTEIRLDHAAGPELHMVQSVREIRETTEHQNRQRTHDSSCRWSGANVFTPKSANPWRDQQLVSIFLEENNFFFRKTSESVRWSHENRLENASRS